MSDHRSMRGVYLILGILLPGTVLVALSCGAVHVPWSGFTTSPVMKLRLARVILALFAGASLSVAGCVLQSLMRNPLAEPYLLGVSSGAGVAAVVTVCSGLSVFGTATTPVAAFFGAMGAILLVCALARQRDGSTPVGSLLLSGAILNSILGSVLIFVVSVSSSEYLHGILWWMLGNLQIFDWNLLAVTGVITVFGIGICLVLARPLNLISLGDETATQLGVEVQRVRLILLMVASLLTAGTIAACGLIGFVGLIVPHTIRLLVGSDHRRLIPVSVLGGAIFLTAADTVARTAMDVEIPIGVITSLVGGPFFLGLLRRHDGMESGT
ncbi:MAG: iron ABC transporter permease [Planctomycetia bacterium]|nr:iron ABC transporter permease [Planctomycetia bacterium]